MALQSINDIGPGKTLAPNSETARLQTINANRRLYNRDFAALRVPNIDDGIPGLKVNWFRRIARFYPEFVFGETPVVTVAGNERLTALLADMGKRLWSAISRANRDRIRFGYGVVASHPTDPSLIWDVDPASHYEVVDTLGDVEADLILRERPNSDGQNGHLDIYVYPVDDGPAERRVHRFASGIVGERVATIPLPPRAGRQVAILPEAGERLSVYDDIAESVGEISRTMTSLATTIRRNLRPHLYGPEGILSVDDNGDFVVDPDGMFLPLPDGESRPPGYLQWDAKLDAVQYDVKQHTDIILAMTGLSRVLFEPESKTGVTSGVALRRLLLPFVARLNTMRVENDCFLESVLAIIVRNIAANGGEIYTYEPRDIAIRYGYESIFTDDAGNPNNGGENE